MGGLPGGRGTRMLLSLIALASTEEARDADAPILPPADTEADATVRIDGREYPKWLQHIGKKQVLTGGGTRYKYGLAKVYALGLYIDEGAISGRLGAWAGTSDKVLAKDASFTQAVISGNFDRTLALQFHRSVDGATVAGAIKDSLASRLDATIVASFHAALNGALAAGTQVGTRLYFLCKPDGLHIAVATTKIVASVTEPSVCGALFEVYYGSSPVAPAAKDGMISGFSKLTAPRHDEL